MKTHNKTLRSFIREESGQTAILAAVCLVAVISFIALATDLGNLRYQQRKLQSAADAAALAAGLEFSACGTTNGCTAMQQAAKRSVVENNYAGATFVQNCAATATSGTTLMLNNPVCATGTSDPNKGNRNYVEVVIKQYQPTYFARIFGLSKIPVSARAEATRAPAPCIYALEPNPTVLNAIAVDALAVVNAKCPIVDESRNAWALGCNVLAGVAATSIHISGGAEGLLCTGGITPRPEIYAPIPTPADPLAYHVKPTPAKCTQSALLPNTQIQILGAVTLNPGTYCGGLIIGPLANVTFNPGVYIFTPSGINLLGISIPLTGGLTITAGAVVQGNGVTFYNAGPCTGCLTGGINFVANTNVLGIIKSISNVSLKAPTTGTYAGMLFMQDPTNTAPATIAASILGGVQLEGAMYFPAASVAYIGAGTARFNILVAKDIDFLALDVGQTAYEKTVFGNDYSQLPGGVSPISPTGAVLVQ